MKTITYQCDLCGRTIAYLNVGTVVFEVFGKRVERHVCPSCADGSCLEKLAATVREVPNVKGWTECGERVEVDDA